MLTSSFTRVHLPFAVANGIFRGAKTMAGMTHIYTHLLRVVLSAPSPPASSSWLPMWWMPFRQHVRPYIHTNVGSAFYFVRSSNTSAALPSDAAAQRIHCVILVIPFWYFVPRCFLPTISLKSVKWKFMEQKAQRSCHQPEEDGETKKQRYCMALWCVCGVRCVYASNIKERRQWMGGSVGSRNHEWGNRNAIQKRHEMACNVVNDDRPREDVRMNRNFINTDCVYWNLCCNRMSMPFCCLPFVWRGTAWYCMAEVCSPLWPYIFLHSLNISYIAQRFIEEMVDVSASDIKTSWILEIPFSSNGGMTAVTYFFVEKFTKVISDTCFFFSTSDFTACSLLYRNAMMCNAIRASRTICFHKCLFVLDDIGQGICRAMSHKQYLNLKLPNCLIIERTHRHTNRPNKSSVMIFSTSNEILFAEHR